MIFRGTAICESANDDKTGMMGKTSYNFEKQFRELPRSTSKAMVKMSEY
jgi:hypothetical protein